MLTLFCINPVSIHMALEVYSNERNPVSFSARGIVYSHLKSRRRQFYDQLDRVRGAVIMGLFQRNTAIAEAFEGAAGEVALCAPAAEAITRSVRRLVGNDKARIVYVTYEPTHVPHFITEVDFRTGRRFICSTYGQFDERLRRVFVVDTWDLVEGYGFNVYRKGMGNADDDAILRRINDNYGLLNVSEYLSTLAKVEYAGLQASILPE